MKDAAAFLAALRKALPDKYGHRHMLYVESYRNRDGSEVTPAQKVGLTILLALPDGLVVRELLDPDKTIADNMQILVAAYAVCWVTPTLLYGTYS